MDTSASIRCRLVACRGFMGAGWDFYLINDGEVPIDSAELLEIGHEWGNLRATDPMDVTVENIAPGRHEFICSESGSAEGRVELVFRMQVQGREARLNFEFPKLYKLTDQHLKPVAGLRKRGYAVAAESTVP